MKDEDPVLAPDARYSGRLTGPGVIHPGNFSLDVLTKEDDGNKTQYLDYWRRGRKDL
jgi:hypothetical protein